MTKIQMTRKYDLQERTLKFAKDIIQFCKKLPRNIINDELIKQLIKASGSGGANYIEANESLSKKDFYHRIRICRKESKESRYWLRLIISANSKFEKDADPYDQESLELTRIFGSIIEKE